MITYNEAYEKTLEYFQGDDLATKVFLDKYALRDKENNLLESTPTDMHKRIAKEFARIEIEKFKNPFTKEQIFELLDHFKYIVPQGSPMYGIGNSYQTVSLSNCFVVESPEDSYGSILKTDQELVQISKRRGGVGLDISNLRPINTQTNNASRKSTGITAFMERYSNSIREVGQGGRRGALMISLDIKHPQSEDFATIKNDDTKVTGANISLKIDNQFFNAVKNEEDYNLQWPIDSSTPTITKTIKAKELWNTIIESAWLRAEPGILFWDNILNESIPDCYKEDGFGSSSTNPCAEIPLSPWDSCRLLVLNLYSYVENPFTKEAKFNYDLFFKHAKIAQRLMDDLVDLEIESIDKIIRKIKEDPESKNVKLTELNLWEKVKNSAIRGRRTGLGATGLGDVLASLNIKYASDESLLVVDEIYKTLKLGAYTSSMEMAKGIGSFPVFNFEKEKGNQFLLRIKEQDPKLYENFKKYGRRNIALLTSAPTGSLSLLTQTTSGIEPLFMMSYKRRKKVDKFDENQKIHFTDKSEDNWEEFEVFHSKVKIWMEVTGESDLTKCPYYNACAEDLSWYNRIKLQSIAGKHIDHSISSTINLPENVTKEEVGNIYLTAWELGCKGITVYRKNSRSGVLVESKAQEFKQSEAVKRPKELPGNVHHFKIQSQEYYVTVGLFENMPYEIFVGKNNVNNEDIFIPRNVKSGKIVKLKRGVYHLLTEEQKYILADRVEITNDEIDDTTDALTRMVSTSLRHGAPISFVVQQLEKTKGELFTFSKALARALKKYIKEGEKVYGDECPSCGGDNLIRENGCIRCIDCGYSKCE